MFEVVAIKFADYLSAKKDRSQIIHRSGIGILIHCVSGWTRERQIYWMPFDGTECVVADGIGTHSYRHSLPMGLGMPPVTVMEVKLRPLSCPGNTARDNGFVWECRRDEMRR